MSIVGCEVTGQCRRCGEFFTLEVYLGRQDQQLHLIYHPRILIVSSGPHTRLVHRPGICDGEVFLYESAYGHQLAAHLTHASHHTRYAGAAAATGP